MSAEAQRATRCPNCGRLLGKATGHQGCVAAFEVKCGRCGELVLVSLDPDIHPYIHHSTTT